MSPKNTSHWLLVQMQPSSTCIARRNFERQASDGSLRKSTKQYIERSAYVGEDTVFLKATCSSASHQMMRLGKLYAPLMEPQIGKLRTRIRDHAGGANR